MISWLSRADIEAVLCIDSIARRTVPAILSLDAPVRAYPPYPGDEKVYLRSLLALISAATTLVPAGTLVKPEEAEAGWQPAPNEEEGYAPPAAAACEWVSKYYGVLDIGRTTHP